MKQKNRTLEASSSYHDMNNDLIYSMDSRSNTYMYMRGDKVGILGQKEYYKEYYNNTILSNSSNPPVFNL